MLSKINNDLVTIDQAAVIANKTKAAVFYHIKAQKFPVTKLTGKCYLIRRSDAEKIRDLSR